MLKMRAAMRCTDKRTKQVGDFGFHPDRPMYSRTPVFDNIQELSDYCQRNNIKLVYPGELWPDSP